MKTNLVKGLATLATGALIATGAAVTAPANAAPAAKPAAASAKAGDTSLAEVLAKDGTKFDKNSKDFDILEAAVLAVVQAKPNSPVALLTDGSVKLTAFLPTDGAFRQLAKDLTGKGPKSEAKVASALLAAAGVDTIEQVLLYHVVPGQTLTSPKVIKAAKAGAKLKTAEGAKVKVTQKDGDIVLVDKAKKLTDPTVVAVDVNKGNKQIGHAIDRVLLPINP